MNGDSDQSSAICCADSGQGNTLENELELQNQF